MNCVTCNALIDASNDSKEHLIANAIGGRLKLRGILCCVCNATTGKDWDSELAEQLHPLSLLFAIKRERGDVPYRQVVTADGDALYLHGDGSLRPVPVHKVHEEGGVTRIEMHVETLQEAREILEKLKQRRYPKLDVDKALLSRQVQEKFDNVINFQLPFGGPAAGRAAVKSALCLAVSNGIDASACSGALDYLQHSQAEPCFGFFFERDVILDRPARVPLHCVAVSNRGTDGQLLAYLEYYGVHRIVVRLSDQFARPDIHSSYSINPVTGEELKLQFNIGLSRDDLARCFDYGCMPPGSRENALDNVMPLAVEIGQKRAWKNALSEALKFGWDNCGAIKGEPLTVEHTRNITQLTMQRLQSFLIHNLQRQKRGANAEPSANDR